MALLAVKCPLHEVERKEYKQERYIREYAKAHNVKIVDIVHTHGFGQNDVNRIFMSIVSMIKKKKADGIIIANMKAIAPSISDTYYKVGMVHEAGGQIVTVDENRLRLNIIEETGR